MGISLRRVGLVLPCAWMLACSVSASSSRSTSSGSSASGGCGGSRGSGGSSAASVNAPPSRPDDDRSGAPSEPAPTGQQWKPIETDEGCGRSGLRWILVDEVCGDGTATADPRGLETPMFRDGALVGDHLMTVDATHLWALDLSAPGAPARSALITGLGQPLSMQARGSRLFLAAGLDGLVTVDASDPFAPSRGPSLALPGPAFDVALDGDAAFLTMGAKGVAVVDVAANPSLVKTLPVPGIAAGVAVAGQYAYVASCTTFAIVDRATGSLQAQAWVPSPVVGKRLVAPAKDVAIVGSVAFVAAGKLGAVAIDISTPTAPRMLGSCRVDAPAFYASGVRAEGSNVFVAGGEWGVLRIDATSPASACTMSLSLPPEPSGPAPGDCTTKPPWEIVPWEQVWAPPPPGKDPIQVLPAGDRVYAFGDARRVGVRAVDVRSSTPSLSLLGRYDEPRTLLGIAARGDRVVAVGPRGGVFHVDAGGALTRTPTPEDAKLATATSVVIAGDGRWVARADKELRVEGRATPIPLVADVTAMTARGLSEIALATSSGVRTIDLNGASLRSALYPTSVVAHLPAAIAADETRIWSAAPEWTDALETYAPTGAGGVNASNPLATHDVFDAEDALDANLWRVRVPRRHLATTSRGLVEVAGLGARAGVVLHSATGPKRAPLVPLTYAAMAADDDHAFVLGIDRGLYKSYLVVISLTGAAPRVTSVEAFTGASSGVAVSGGRVFVADADGAIRLYSVAGEGVVPADVVRVEVTP